MSCNKLIFHYHVIMPVNTLTQIIDVLNVITPIRPLMVFYLNAFQIPSKALHKSYSNSFASLASIFFLKFFHHISELNRKFHNFGQSYQPLRIQTYFFEIKLPNHAHNHFSCITQNSGSPRENYPMLKLHSYPSLSLFPFFCYKKRKRDNRRREQPAKLTSLCTRPTFSLFTMRSPGLATNRLPLLLPLVRTSVPPGALPRPTEARA